MERMPQFPQDSEYDDRDTDDEIEEREYFRSLDATAPAPREDLEAQIAELQDRLNMARMHLAPLLPMLEKGTNPPAVTIDSRLTSALAHLGCAVCGKKFTRDQAATLTCVRLYGVHPGHCSRGRS